ncbi:MAG: hypothetical protein ACRDS9_07825 [Pseudonocardiaceae bacterium]
MKPLPMWNDIAHALREVDDGRSGRRLEWPVEAFVQSGLQESAGFAAALGVDGPGTWVAGKNGLADSARIEDGTVLAGVEVKITAQENAANYHCTLGCTMQLEHLAHQGTLVIVTSSQRAKRDRAIWPASARVMTLTEIAAAMDQSEAPDGRSLVRALFGLGPIIQQV